MKEASLSIRQQERTFPATSTSTLPLDRRVTRSNTRQRFATLFAHDEDAESSILISRPTLVLNGPDEGNDNDITEEFSNPFNQDFDEMDVDSSSEESEDHDPDNADNKPEESGSSDEESGSSDIDPRPNDNQESGSSDNEESGSDDEESGSSDDNLQPNDPNNRPDEIILSRFRAFCHPNRFITPLTPTEMTGVRLLDVL